MATSPDQSSAGTGKPHAADDTPKFRYNETLANRLELKWQAFWDQHGTFRQANPGEPGFDASKPKFYCLDMFPYPSGAGLHVGHPEGYTATDIISRFMRMKGANVLHPMGWDAFGLPAEQYAIATGVHPAKTTRASIETFRRQLKRFGFSYDWSREVGTIDEDYYRFTQWIFLKLYNSWFDPQADSPAYPDGKKRRGAARPIADLIRQLEGGDLRVGFDGDVVHIGGASQNPIPMTEPVGTRRWHELSRDEQRAVIDSQRMAYIDEMTVNWCPELGTVLANDEVIDGKSERGGHPVLRKPLKQWQLRITSYAQRLLDDLDLLDWPHATKAMQSEWIGKSTGAEIDFEIVGSGGLGSTQDDDVLTVFTTRPDTIFGATYMVVAPEHPLVDRVLSEGAASERRGTQDQLRRYVAAAKNKSDVDRMADAKDKTGVFTGVHAINPATGAKIPVWTADYVLMGYGTGAIMAVPAHDERDWAFAKKFGLPVKRVIESASPTETDGFHIILNPSELTLDQTSMWSQRLGESVGGSGDGIELSEVSFETQQAAQRFCEEHLRAKRPGQSITIHKGGGVSFGAYTGDGVGVNSANAEVSLNGLSVDDAKRAIIAWLESKGIGSGKTNFRLRDWVFSRQRYWGEPIPIVFDEKGDHYPIDESKLPLVLPELSDYTPVPSDEPQPLLAKATSWMNTTAGAAGVSPDLLDPSTPVRRETNTMPGSAGSSWYFLRYADPKGAQRPIGRDVDAYWMGQNKGASKIGGVDLYIGGSEHAVGHLLYSRFWQKVLFDLGEVSTPEPFQRLFHQGMITSYAYQRPDKTIVPMDEVQEDSTGAFVETKTGTKLSPIVTKMSKRYKNVINPDDVIAEFGADTFRLYEMYMGPLDASKPWNTKDTVGCYRFLQRAWRLCVDEETGELRFAAAANPAVDKQLHKTIAKVDQDVPRLAFNTAIAAMMEFVNVATSSGGLTREQMRLFALVLAPFAPHMGEELWHKLGSARSLSHEPFPVADASLVVDDTIEIPVQVAGKVRAKINVPRAATKDETQAMALADPKVAEFLAGKAVQRIVVVPGKMVNIVV